MSELTLIDQLILGDHVKGMVSPKSSYFARRLEKYKDVQGEVQLNCDHVVIFPHLKSLEEKVVILCLVVEGEEFGIKEMIKFSLMHGESNAFHSSVFKEKENTSETYRVQLEGEHINKFTLFHSVVEVSLFRENLLWVSVHTYPADRDPVLYT